MPVHYRPSTADSGSTIRASDTALASCAVERCCCAILFVIMVIIFRKLVAMADGLEPQCAECVGDIGGDSVVRVHFSTLLPGDLWLVELRTPAGLSSTPWPQDASVTRVLLDGGATLQVLARLAV